jgi:4-hydroxybenzoate polyprenyltransferase
MPTDDVKTVDPLKKAGLPDATSHNWVDRYAPYGLKPWLRLGRFDRPVGIWLLFLPGAMGLCLGAPSLLNLELGVKLILFAFGAALMRAAGCAYNDYVDRDIDAQVERTKLRPIPAGQISPKQALIYIAICCSLSLIILLQLGNLAIGLGVASLGLVALYPFMKRITWWPQAWLGLTFNWGLLMGYASMTETLSFGAILFYAGLVFWTIGYDTIYALQDTEDDALIGVKSSALALKDHTRLGVGAFYALALGFTGLGGALSDLTLPFYGGLLCVGGHLVWQVYNLRIDQSTLWLSLFKSNRETGIFWVLAIGLGQFWQ